MYINLMETIITSVNHRIEAQASISTNDLSPMLLFEARRVFQARILLLVTITTSTPNGWQHYISTFWSVFRSIRENANVEMKWTDLYHFKLQHSWFCQHCLWTAPVGLMSVKIAQTRIRRFLVRIFISKLNCFKFEHSYFCFLPVPSDDGWG